MSALFLSTPNARKANHVPRPLQAFKAIYNGRIYCGHLYGLSETAREEWALDPNIQLIVNHFLRTVNPPEVDKNSMRARSTNAILSQANSILTLPGGAGQALHRDDSIWQKVHPSQEESGYCLGSDLGIALLVPGVQTTRANGATLVSLFSPVYRRPMKKNHSFPSNSVVCSRIPSLGRCARSHRRPSPGRRDAAGRGFSFSGLSAPRGRG